MTCGQKEEFRHAVCEIVRLIPSGRATTYGSLARAAGYPAYARMVGKIMSDIPAGVGMPAHRVVASGGVLSGSHAFGGPGKMQRLLEEEGVVVTGNRIKEWKKVYWDPLAEL